ncbi:cytochrome P450 3A4 [Trichonephila clavipes]|nr:cytochrome P450 3A4 [Trichonephila clavipes]
MIVKRYSIRNFDYWKIRNVPYVKPLPFVGSLLENMTKPLNDTEIRRHQEHGNIYGYFEGSRPVLSIADPKLLRDIFVKDFHVFPERRPMATGDKIVDKMMSTVTGDDWKRIRAIITPTFTTGKIKRMLGIFKECAEALVENCKTASVSGQPIEAKKMYGAFTMDLIASAAFSTKLDSHNDPENQFVVMARKIFRITFSWRIFLFFLFPKFVKWLRISVIPPKATSFFRDVTLQIIEERKRTGQTRNDFLQLLMDTTKEMSQDPKSELYKEENTEAISVYEEVNPDHQVFRGASKKNLSMDELVAQCVMFFLAGYDSTASNLSFVTYMLALHPDIQERLHDEIVQTFKEANGKLTYDAVQNMKYLDNVISETLRLFPPTVRLERSAAADYKLKETGITIPEGMLLTIPIYVIHRDSEKFPEPEKFDPDRFTPEKRAERDPYSYLPFGAGPRNCIGIRFGLMGIKVCLTYVITHFIIKRCPETKVPLEFITFAGLLEAKEVMVALERRNDSPLKINAMM